MNKKQLSELNNLAGKIEEVQDMIAAIEHAKLKDAPPLTSKRDPAKYGLSLFIGGSCLVTVGAVIGGNQHIHSGVISDKEIMDLVDRNNVTILKLLRDKLTVLEAEFKEL